jgi:exonuclease SbcC
MLVDNAEKALEQHADNVRRESEVRGKIGKVESDIASSELMIAALDEKLEIAQTTYTKMCSNLLSDDVESELTHLSAEIDRVKKKISEIDTARMKQASSLGKHELRLENARKDQEKFSTVKHNWIVYEMLMEAISKRGIPLQIIMSQLPLINAEIAKILRGVTAFTVELEAEAETNEMDVYINYSDTPRRPIEVASGMEKMIASLAIRVALINISSLPKTDMLIIDEGFGTLDDVNVEACNRLLVSLKQWFKHIIVITHVDGVKDVVDNVLDITWNGRDAHVEHI